MSTFLNPFYYERPAGVPEHAAKIKSWVRQALRLDKDTVISVNDLACNQPDCPPRVTVVLVLQKDAPARKFEIHKALLETNEQDVLSAITDETAASSEHIEF
ncbi:hypothetical protein AAFN47_17905 [Hoeflea sp. CAU 1731]